MKVLVACEESQAVCNANLEAINFIKLQMRLLENQLQREWGQNEEKHYKKHHKGV